MDFLPTGFLPGVPEERVLTCLRRAPGNELAPGKFDSPESSAALASNAFGWFLDRPGLLAPLPGVPMGRPEGVEIEAEMRFPWRGGKHPRFDAAITTATTLVGVESKRYEPFRPQKAADFSLAYDRDWREGLARYTALRRDLAAGRKAFRTLGAAELIRQAYGLATQGARQGRGAVLVYLYAEPERWASGKPLDPAAVALHRKELAEFAGLVRGDLVSFMPLTWRDLLAQWAATPATAAHAGALLARFGPL
ncbi:PGN_0703 family putative restriction endonuclease [Pseudogemmobacter humi]|uniref:Uncharacterized protein n=1 Tax=Pseudogemmobacter humi TaxID=2483812 RepID=A0A3P5WYP7_9RHOB|nr:hypothetical protein [Pseudogemmobacter humi]VDC28352.1 hypothetical protein XINFAN_02091 [Pseudogemmobacter humi]